MRGEEDGFARIGPQGRVGHFDPRVLRLWPGARPAGPRQRQRPGDSGTAGAALICIRPYSAAHPPDPLHTVYGM
jgi:hypothetical protein